MNNRPEITISSLDAQRLFTLIESLPTKKMVGISELEEELARAIIVDPKEIPTTIVTMNSTVKFTVEASREEFLMTLVYPKDLDLKGDKISILAPVGSALLGLAQGDQIEWPKPGGGLIKITINEIFYQPERAGEYHR
ncbi:nucleoside diphosphate kinase regulator [Shewanella frigidimarina]|jgi:regulator of nucleoside diphosphate kinase|uniref:GreA/GreB family elongation factor n=1 Tax=Shewanella frigidimarina (strain NCIMB 400) TaxID=318167 RepID=Q082G6_SHEFN|nr:MULTISPECIES: nucleoside diphosphate kinase regulator [Shewanella]ABI71849.1 GreA/GreB family elongation factor [Shewanella frigidimarina NCIMB 400]MBB1426363.1 nucleoside diphosphate kinase regulator [Shewanella sp. SG44-2]RPA31248.1 nucleoside diphosphate kinase regulator [Shewanella frigidimarina]RPA61419.1 nucleoside diphosphate kinase regulator [Shewanella frigidimarina]|tara:strand:+ start:3350 stop:3763 length:414 start_codon:yes stop_codon:yes gene_type:complete